MNVKDCLLLFNCLDCKKNYKKKFDKDLVKRLESMCNTNTNIWIFRKDFMKHYYQIRKNFTLV